MTPEQVNQAVQSYLKIKELEKQLQESHEKNIYALIYKPKYGDYKEFVEHVAERLRVINKEGGDRP